ncbi:hypothetical protein ACHAW6_007548 [Cyclotella cf. meneghiniana]
MADDQQLISQRSTIPTQLRTAYQQHASAFLLQHAASRLYASWIGDAARSLTLRAIYSHPCKYNSSTHVKHQDLPATSSGSIVSWRDYVCMACGTPSYPLTPSSTLTCTETPSKINLRTLQRRRTRRRRSSRSRAAQLHKQSIFQKRIGNIGNTSNLHLALAWAEKQRELIASLHRLGDGSARHCVVVRCRFCGNEKKRKGIEVKSVGKEMKKRKTPVAPTATSTKTSTSTMRSKEETKKKDEFDDSNFISLPNLESVAQKKRKEDRVHHGVDTSALAPTKNFSFKNITTTTKSITTTSLLSGAKKKKAKRKPVTSTGLMDFLSSLND